MGELSEALTGAIDLHAHPAPDIVPRSQTIAEALEDFSAAGFAGFVAKSHVGSTAPLCSAHAGSGSAEAIGSICLNRPVGGLNAGAVEVAALLGARVVWLPTVDSRRQREEATSASGPAPVWADAQEALVGRRGYGPPVTVLDGGHVVPELHNVLDVVREHGLLLATGHLDSDEVFAVLGAAREHGIERVMVTHPDLSRQRISHDAQIEMARRGAWIERTWASVMEGKLSLDAALQGIRACGTGSTLLTGDLCQPHNGAICNGIRRWADCLYEAGFEPEEIHQILVVNPTLALGRIP
ncbi:MAG: cytosolic protein [Sinomonas sp.]|nr:cytosolic protein [Sinomonas sp.]